VIILDESLGHDLRRTRPLLDFGHLLDGLRDSKLGPPLFVFAGDAVRVRGYMIAMSAGRWRAPGLGSQGLGCLRAFGAVVAVISGWGFGKLAPRFATAAWHCGHVRHGVAVAIVPWLPPVRPSTVDDGLAFATAWSAPRSPAHFASRGPGRTGSDAGAAQGLSALAASAARS